MSAAMNREQFERLRDLKGKMVDMDVRLVQRTDVSSAWEAKDIPILNAEGVDARMTVQVIAETGAKTINVKIAGVGPICRLEVDSRPHRPAGRSHKHALRTPDCPRENLKREVVDRADLSGRSIAAVFDAFCRMAHIDHRGTLIVPPELDGA